VFVSPWRNTAAARTFLNTALAAHGEPDEVITDLAQALETVIEELIPTRFTTPTNTQTIGSSVITGDSKPGSDLCEDSRPTAQHRW
jgi:transposase-like protein